MDERSTAAEPRGLKEWAPRGQIRWSTRDLRWCIVKINKICDICEAPKMLSCNRKEHRSKDVLVKVLQDFELGKVILMLIDMTMSLPGIFLKILGNTFVHIII